MMRLSRLCAKDSYVAAQHAHQAVLHVRDPAKRQHQLAALLRESRPQEANVTVSVLLSYCKSRKLWQPAVDVVIAAAGVKKVRLDPSWFQTCVECTSGHPGEVQRVSELLADVWPLGQPVENARRSGDRGTADLPYPQLTDGDRHALSSIVSPSAAAAVTDDLDALELPGEIPVTATSTSSTSLAAELPKGLLKMGSPGMAQRMGRASLSLRANAAFGRYYLGQRIVEGEAELAKLVAALQQPPIPTMRINRSFPGWELVREAMLKEPRLKPVPWYPEKLAFQLVRESDNNKSVLGSKGNDGSGGHDAADASLLARQFLQRSASMGWGSFQSPSSLLPALALDPQPGEAVLDLCAAPGSKTSQVIDLMLGRAATAVGSGKGGHHGAASWFDSCRSGVVVACDRSASRMEQLRRRVDAPHAGVNAITVACDGTQFPLDFLGGSDGGGHRNGMGFDRVLCDVPCSADGRMHREEHRWRQWHPIKGVELFNHQLALLRRAVDAARPDGGTILYSTCTLNPVENEAVVAALLRERGDVVLEPIRKFGFGHVTLRLQEGLSRVGVPQPDGSLSFDKSKTTMRHDVGGGIPALQPVTLREETTKAIQEHCRRVHPHRQYGMDGFFLAKLVKRGDSGVSRSMHAVTDGRRGTPGTKKQGRASLKALPTDSAAVSAVLDMFAIPPNSAVRNGSMRFMASSAASSTRSNDPVEVFAVGTAASASLQKTDLGASAGVVGSPTWIYRGPSEAPVLSEAGCQLLAAYAATPGPSAVSTTAAPILRVPVSMMLFLLSRGRVDIRRDFLDQRLRMLKRSEDIESHGLPPLQEHQTWVAAANRLQASASAGKEHAATTDIAAIIRCDARVGGSRGSAPSPSAGMVCLPTVLDTVRGELSLQDALLPKTRRDALRALLTAHVSSSRVTAARPTKREDGPSNVHQSLSSSSSSSASSLFQPPAGFSTPSTPSFGDLPRRPSFA